MPVRLHHAATDVAARVVLLGDAPIAPGTEAFVQLVLEAPIAAAAGDRFVLRDTTAQRTIGGGRFLDLRAPARKRRTPERLAQLEAHAIVPPETALAALLDRAAALRRPVGLRARPCARLGREPMRADPHPRRRRSRCLAGTWLHAQAQPRRDACGLSQAENPDLPGIGLERLRMQLQPRLPAPAFVAMLQGLARAHDVALDGAWVRLPGHEVRLTPADEKLWGAHPPADRQAPSASARRACATSPVSSVRRGGRAPVDEAALAHGQGRRGRA